MKTRFIKTILFVTTLLVGCSMFADEKVTVAVFNFSVTSTAQKIRQLGPKLTSLVTAELSTNDNITLVERAQLSKALKEQALGLSGVVDPKAAAKVGHLTGAKVLVAAHGFKPGGGDNFVVTVNVIGTESGRLFVEKVDGTTANATKLAHEITERIVKVIAIQATNLVADAGQSEPNIDDIVKLATGKRRPSVLIKIMDGHRHIVAAEYELGMIFHQAGFPVIDAKSYEKPAIEIDGDGHMAHMRAPENMWACRVILAVNTKDTAEDKVLSVDQIKQSATDADKIAAQKVAYARAADELAAKLLPVLSK